MIPILYDAKETNFNNNGLGMLSDCTYCTITEERNGSFELELRYPIEGQLYESIKYDSIIKAMPNELSSLQLFRVYYNSKPINGLVTFKAEHISYQLNKIAVSPFTANSITEAFTQLKAKSAIGNPFEMWTDVTKNGTMTVAVPSSFRSLLGGVSGSVLDVYGGEYEWDNYTVRLHSQRGQDRGVKILYGKNLKDVTQEENISNALTGIYPYYKADESTILELPEKVIQIQSTYAYPRIAPVDLSSSFESGTTVTVDMLREAANKYIKNNDIAKPTISIQVQFEPLWQTEGYEDIAGLERVGLCDTVEVEFYKLGVSAKAKVVKTVFDVLKEKYESIEIGDARTNIADTIVQQQQEIDNAPSMSTLEQAIAAATNAITGNSGGYVVLRPAKNPQEILIMDTPDINTAKKVWRWNSGGLGYSSNGYNGPFALAMTNDGQIVANRITSGILNANIIQAGVIRSSDSNVYFDLDSGVLRASNLVGANSGDTYEILIGNNRTSSGALSFGFSFKERNKILFAIDVDASSGNTELIFYNSAGGWKQSIRSWDGLMAFDMGSKSPLVIRENRVDINVAELKVGEAYISPQNCFTGSFLLDNGSRINVSNGLITSLG